MQGQSQSECKPVMAFVVNGLQYFLSHRLAIANRLLEQGYTVHIVAPDDCPENFNQYGFIYHQVKISRKSVNPFVEFMVIQRLSALFKTIRPDLVHLVTGVCHASCPIS